MQSNARRQPTRPVPDLRGPLPAGLHRPRALLLALLLSLPLLLVLGAATAAQSGGLVTQRSTQSAIETTKRLRDAIAAIGWVVLGEVDHAAAARAAGMELRTRTVLLFGNPKAGTPPMRSHPTLAIDLPMRVLVWEDDQGNIMVTRSTGDDVAERVFARHGTAIDASGRAGTERVLDGLVRKATE